MLTSDTISSDLEHCMLSLKLPATYSPSMHRLRTCDMTALYDSTAVAVITIGHHTQQARWLEAGRGGWESKGR